MTVITGIKNGIGIVQINRPAARNAVNPETARELFAAFQGLDADPAVSAMVFGGTQGAFCAGFDLKSAASGDGADWIKACAIPPGWADALADPLPGPMGPSRLWLTKPVIAAIEGHAVAGGMERAAWCDMRVVATSAIFGVFCRRWGVPLIDGGTVRLPALLGQGRANDLILTGRPVGADEAAAIGLADRVVQEGTALEAALDLAASLGRFPQGCLLADHASARIAPDALARALTREWQSVAVLDEALKGAARFAGGLGRGGDFDAI